MTNLPLSQLAASELLARRQARGSLIEFTRYTNPIYSPADHHRKIAEALESVARGEITRLMICLPPRHGKSELASRRFPAWYLGRYPSNQIIAACYNSDLASDFGREVRNIVNSDEYRCLFDCRLAVDSQAANRWHTDQSGMYVAAGVGTAITGRGAHILLIDDPFKDRQEADSEIRRESVWNWYTSTAYTRLMPGGAVIVINTRWHDDDLSGRLLEQAKHGGDQWTVISMPAVSDTGEALWPEWYDMKRLDEIKSVLPARDWNSLYQQNPIPDDGDYFKVDWFGEYEDLPTELTYWAASDCAVTDDGGDFTEHGVFGIDQNKNIYVVDWWRGKTTADKWIESQCDLILAYSPQYWFGEKGVIQKSIEPYMVQRMTERNAFCRLEWLPSVADKPTRARTIQGMASMGKIFMPKHAKWKGDILNQLLRFPAGKHDDAVDVFSLIGRGMEFYKPKKAVKPINFEGAY